MNIPLYQSIYNQLKKEIENQKYDIGDTLPTEKELSTIYNVSNITVKKALDLLKDDGFIERKPRKGSIVINARKSELPSKKGIFGIVITNFTDFFGSQILRSIVSSYGEQIHFILKISYGDQEKENYYIQELINIGIQGLILLPTSSEYTSPKILELIANDFPIVILDRLMANLPICSVQTDSYHAAKEITSYLFNKKHVNIGLITSDSTVSTIDERVKGFLSAHIDENIAVSQEQILSVIDSVVPNSTQSISDDISSIIKFLERNKSITALFTTEYNIALLAKSAIERMGKRVPEDYSIVCFDHPEANIFDINAFVFTHIQQKQSNLGKMAVELLLKKIESPKLIEKINLDYNLIEGNSVVENCN